MSENYKMLRCEACGGELQYSEDRKSAVCLNCGNTYHFRDEKSEAVIMALNIANGRRIACDFDTAVINYKALIERNPDDAEAHWGLVLSTYGIEYVEDPRTRKHIPTCRRTIRESILENANYKAALANAAPEQRAVYEEKAVIIDRLQKKIKRQLEDEEEYDVFISFKSTDENGNPTKDRQIARRIYDELNNRGIKTFFSEVTLKSRLGEDFEPIIYKALYSCKFFILVATSVENMNSAWVKNEWSRFRDRVFDEALSNPGCAVFENMSPNDLPPFLKGQGVSLAKYPAGGYEIEIADNLSAKFGLTNKNEEAEEIRRQIEEQKKLQQSLEEKLRNVQNNTRASGGATVGSLLIRADQELSVGAFEKAGEYYQKAADIDPMNGKAFWGLFLCDMKARTVQEVAKRTERKMLQQVLSNKNFKFACKYSDIELKRDIALYSKMVSSELGERIQQLEAAYEKRSRERKDYDSKIKSATDKINEICHRAKQNGVYDKELFEKQGLEFNKEIGFQKADGEESFAKIVGVSFIGGIAVAILFFILGIISSVKESFFPALGVWVNSWPFGPITVPLVIGIIALVIIFIIGLIFRANSLRKENAYRRIMVKRHNKEVEISNQVISLRRGIVKLQELRKVSMDEENKVYQALSFDKEFYSKICPSKETSKR